MPPQLSVKNQECGASTRVQPPKKLRQRRPLLRANSTSTVRVDETMSHPNNKTTITQVALVISNLINRNKTHCHHNKNNKNSSNTLDLVCQKSNDLFGERYTDNQASRHRPQEPSTKHLASFMYYIFETAQCSSECPIISLLLIERLVEHGNIRITSRNWRSIIGVAMMLASKVWDDLSMINTDFSTVLGYPLSSINAWEARFLICLSFDVRVNVSAYTSRYFDLRGDGSHKARRSKLPPNELNVAAAEELGVFSSVTEARVREMRRDSDGMSPGMNNRVIFRRSSTYSECVDVDCEDDGGCETTPAGRHRRRHSRRQSRARCVLD